MSTHVKNDLYNNNFIYTLFSKKKKKNTLEDIKKET